MSSLFFLAQGILITVVYFLWQHIRRPISSVLESIPGPASSSFWTGNIRQFYNPQGWTFHQDVVTNYGTVVRMNGFLNRPILYVYDPKALHHIVVKDQHVYEESRAFIMSNLLVFGPGLLSTLGDHHRKQRKLLNPVFSINHMRHMIPIFYQVVHQLRQAISGQVKDSPQEIDVLNWMGRTALELIGQGGLGYSIDPLIMDVTDPYADAIKAYFPTLFSLSLARMLTPYFAHIGPPWFRRRVLELIPHKKVQRLREIADTMSARAAEIYADKKRALEAGDEAVLKQVGEGKDIISILMKANSAVSEEDKLPEHELVAQMTTFIFAATDTTSNMLSRILHQLALHPDMQARLRREITDAQQVGSREFSYDAMMQLPFLDAVCRETLRVFPPVMIIPREAREDILLPLSAPIRTRDGATLDAIPVPRDTQLLIGVRGANCNTALWGADAFEWKPERWLAPLPTAVTDAHTPGVYSNLMTFNGGGRACIGFKFSELEMKTVLCTLLPSFSFEPPKENIVWNIASVNYPTMGNGSRAEMLLKVTRIEGI